MRKLYFLFRYFAASTDRLVRVTHDSNDRGTPRARVPSAPMPRHVSSGSGVEGAVLVIPGSRHRPDVDPVLDDSSTHGSWWKREPWWKRESSCLRRRSPFVPGRNHAEVKFLRSSLGRLVTLAHG